MDCSDFLVIVVRVFCETAYIWIGFYTHAFVITLHRSFDAGHDFWVLFSISKVLGLVTSSSVSKDILVPLIIHANPSFVKLAVEKSLAQACPLSIDAWVAQPLRWVVQCSRRHRCMQN